MSNGHYKQQCSFNPSSNGNGAGICKSTGDYFLFRKVSILLLMEMVLEWDLIIVGYAAFAKFQSFF